MFRSRIFMVLLLGLSPLLLAGCLQNADKEVPMAAQESDKDGDNEIKKYSREEVARHGAKYDCWTIFQGKVYDISNFIPKHPAGPDKAANACGKDISENFLKNLKHANQGQMNLEKLYIGDLE